MEQGKTRYDFTVSDVNGAVQVIHQFLNMNKYQQYNMNGIVFYMFEDKMWLGKCSLEYYVNGNQITILAYMKTPDNPMPLDGMVGAVWKQAYVQKLNPLFNQLKSMNGQQTQNNQYGQQTNGYNQQSNNYNQYQQNGAYNQNPYGPVAGTDPMSLEIQVRRNKNKFAIIAFVVSLIGLILPLIGLQFGMIINFVVYYLAYIGLGSEKKGFAIASFVLNTLGLLLSVLYLILLFIG